MQSETKKGCLFATVVLIWIPITLCAIFAAMLYWGLAYGVDPLQAPTESDGVSALIGSQRMGDQRIHVLVENRNKYEVAVDVHIETSGRQANTVEVHTVLGPHSARRIYSDNPKEVFGQVLSVSVTKHFDR